MGDNIYENCHILIDACSFYQQNSNSNILIIKEIQLVKNIQDT